MFWNVYLNDKFIDSVWFLKSCSEEEIRKSLIEHDGYDSNIKIVPAMEY
jgi:hypothetical protein